MFISVAAVALIPLSKMIGGSTEDLSLYYGMTIGGFYDLLLIDVKMPKLNGFEFSEKILELDLNVRICYISAAELNIEALREQRFFGAHTYRRTVFYEDWTGQEIIRVLLDQVKLRKIEIVDHVYIIKLLKSDDVGEKEEVPEVKGAIGIDIKKKEIVLFESKSLVLATGGYTRVYAVSSSRIFENYGERLALAYEEI